jgi:hypothetical protein
MTDNEGERSKAPNEKSAWDAAAKAGDKSEKEARMFEPKASCRASRLVARFCGNPKGKECVLASTHRFAGGQQCCPKPLLHQRLAVAFLLLTFLWRSKEK